MDFRLGLVAAGVALAIFWAVVASKPAAAQQARRVLLLGDSFAVGLRAPLLVHANNRGVDLRVAAKVSTRADQWSLKLPDLLAAHAPVLLLVSLGTNDLAGTDPGNVARFAAYVERFRDMAAERSCRIVWLVPTWTRSAPTIRAVLDRAEVAYLVAPDVPLAGDNLHPTTTGYQKWAAEVARLAFPPPQ